MLGLVDIVKERAVSCIQITFRRQTVGKKNAVLIKLDMIVSEWCITPFTGDRCTVHQQFGWHAKPIDNQAVLRRNIQVTPRLPRRDRISRDPDWRRVFDIGMPGQVHRDPANPPHRFQHLTTIAKHNELVTWADCLDRQLAGRRTDPRATDVASDTAAAAAAAFFPSHCFTSD